MPCLWDPRRRWALAAAVWLFPVNGAALTWQLLRTRTTEWRTAGSAAAAAALSASFTALPYVEFDTAAVANLVAYGIAGPTTVLVLSTLRHRDRIPLAWLALVGVFSVHPYLLNQRNVLCLNRNHLFGPIRLRFAYNALPTQRNLPNWLVREQLMEAIKANLLSHQIGSFSQRSRYWSRFVTPAGGDDAGSV